MLSRRIVVLTTELAAPVGYLRRGSTHRCPAYALCVPVGRASTSQARPLDRDFGELIEINWRPGVLRRPTFYCSKIVPMEQKASGTKTGQNSSLRAIHWALAVEREALRAAIGDAMREVMKAERLLAAGVEADAAARSLEGWTAILDSRITRLQSFELRHHNELAAKTSTVRRRIRPGAIHCTYCDEPSSQSTLMA
jgi:hypothetical protein